MKKKKKTRVYHEKGKRHVLCLNPLPKDNF